VKGPLTPREGPSAPTHWPRASARRPHLRRDRVHRALHRSQGRTSIHQGPEQHVARKTRRSINPRHIPSGHHRAIRSTTLVAHRRPSAPRTAPVHRSSPSSTTSTTPQIRTVLPRPIELAVAWRSHLRAESPGSHGVCQELDMRSDGNGVSQALVRVCPFALASLSWSSLAFGVFAPIPTTCQRHRRQLPNLPHR
jgi:hypothetical protein